MTQPSKIWIAACNGSELKIFKYKGPNQDLEILHDLTFQEPHELSQNLVSSKRGRVFHSADGSRSAMERPADPHEKAKREALQKSVRFLDKKTKEFDRLILAAPPEDLGELRKILPDSLIQKEIVELSKDITHLSIKELPSHLKDVINIHEHKFQTHFTARR